METHRHDLLRRDGESIRGTSLQGLRVLALASPSGPPLMRQIYRDFRRARMPQALDQAHFDLFPFPANHRDNQVVGRLHERLLRCHLLAGDTMGGLLYSQAICGIRAWSQVSSCATKA